MDGEPRWRIGADVRSPDIGAAALFAEAVDYDQDPPFPVPGLVRLLSSWVWQEGRDAAWWLGVLVEAQSAADATQRVASVIAARTDGVRTVAATLHATASTARTTQELLDEDELDLHATPGAASPYIVPVRARAYAREGERLTIAWTTTGNHPLAHITVTITESLTIGLFEHRPPLTGPEASGDLLIAKARHAVIEIGDLPADVPVLDRYSGEYLPKGDYHAEGVPIKPFVYAPDS